MTSFAEQRRFARATSGRLRDYLELNFEEIAAEWAGPGRRDLANVHRIILGLGLVDDRGNTPTSQTLTRTWQRVLDKRKFLSPPVSQQLSGDCAHPYAPVNGRRTEHKWAASASPVTAAQTKEHGRIVSTDDEYIIRQIKKQVGDLS